MGDATKVVPSHIWVVIPAYNEERSLPEVIRSLKQRGLTVVVVDDGSDDATYTIAQQCGAIALRNEVNRGKGLTLRRGIEYVLDQDAVDAVITMDGDGQHDPQEVDRFIARRISGSAFVVGNRMSNRLGMPWIRAQTNKVMSIAISTLCQQYIPDTQCGFRLIGREVLDNIFIESDKYEIESEFLLKAAQKNTRIDSIPVSTIYAQRHVSKIHPFVDTVRFIRFILKWFCWNQFRTRKKRRIYFHP